VVAPGNWLREAALAQTIPPGPAPARFLSEAEGEGSEDGDEPAFFSAASSGTRKRRTAQKPEIEEQEMVTAQTRPQFADMDEPSAFIPLPRDFASDFEGSAHMSASAEEHHPQPSTLGIAEASHDEERDLDVPAFMRRLKF
jgi:hypothetical protein